MKNGGIWTLLRIANVMLSLKLHYSSPPTSGQKKSQGLEKLPEAQNTVRRKWLNSFFETRRNRHIQTLSMSRLEILFPDWDFFFFKWFTKPEYNNNVRDHTFYGFYCMSTYHFWLVKSLQLSGYLQHIYLISYTPWHDSPPLLSQEYPGPLSFSLHSYHPSTWKALLLLTPHPTPHLAKFYIFFQSQLSYPVIHDARPVMQCTDCFQMLLQLLVNTDLL